MQLSEQLKPQEIQSNIATDCAKLMEDQVAKKTGISGLAFKAVYGALKSISPNYIHGAIERLLPQVSASLDPIWDEGLKLGNPLAHLKENTSITADIILSVTDTKIEKSQNKIVKVSYKKIRPSVKGEVEEAIPGLTDILEKYIKLN
jgi:hypothetical protein